MKLKMFVQVRRREIPLHLNEVAIITYYYFRSDCYYKSFNGNSERYLKLNFQNVGFWNSR